MDARPENEIVKRLRHSGAGGETGVGRATGNTFLEQDLIVPSPGVPADAPMLQAARAKGVTIWSEVELADRFSPRPLDRDYRVEREDDNHFSD